MYFILEKQHGGSITDVAKAIGCLAETIKVTEMSVCQINKCEKEELRKCYPVKKLISEKGKIDKTARKLLLLL